MPAVERAYLDPDSECVVYMSIENLHVLPHVFAIDLVYPTAFLVRPRFVLLCVLIIHRNPAPVEHVVMALLSLRQPSIDSS